MHAQIVFEYLMNRLDVFLNVSFKGRTNITKYAQPVYITGGYTTINMNNVYLMNQLDGFLTNSFKCRKKITKYTPLTSIIH